MFKLKFLLMFSLLVLAVRPAQAGDFWRDAKQFALRNSGKLGLVILAAAVAYYFLTPDDKPKKAVVPVLKPKSKGLGSAHTKKAYHAYRRQTNRKLQEM